jgi:hypothetical protein
MHTHFKEIGSNFKISVKNITDDSIFCNFHNLHPFKIGANHGYSPFSAILQEMAAFPVTEESHINHP